MASHSFVKKMKSISICVLVVFLGLFNSCLEKKENNSLPLFVQKKENVEVYSTSQKSDTVRLIKEQTYGDIEGLFFSRMGEFTVDTEGRVYIEESAVGMKTIYVFNPDGSYLGKIGKEGKGPGEFEDVCCMNNISDTLYVYDSINSRMSLFSIETLRLLDVFRIDQVNLPEADTNGSFTGRYFFTGNNRILMGFSPPSYLSENDDTLKDIFFYYNKEFQQTSDPILEQNQIQNHWGYFEGHRIRETFPFFEKPLIAVSPTGRIFTAISNNFFVQEIDGEGNYLRSFYYPYKKINVSRKDAYKSSNEMSRNIAETVELPPYWPVLNSMQFDDEERLWISTFTEDENQLAWWVLNIKGELLGAFRWHGNRYAWPLRNDDTMKVIRNGYFYQREQDEETGLRRVVKYRIKVEPV